jgi:hypothetical protein
MHGISGDPHASELEPMLRRAYELVADDDLPTRARLKLDDAWMAWLQERVDEMDGPAREGLELARRVDDRQLLQNALDAVTGSDWLQGRQRSAVEHTRERLALLQNAPQTHALDVERSDALHMMVLCLIQTGDFREAAAYALEGSEIDRSRGVDHGAFQRELMPCFFLGEWDRALELGVSARQAWIDAGRPPLGTFATPAACVAAIHGYRGDEALTADWMRHAYDLVRAHTEQTSGVQMLEADISIHQGRFGDALMRTQGDLPGTQFQAPYSATRAEAFALAGHPDAAGAIEGAEGRVGEHRYAQGVLLRAKHELSGEEGPLRESLALFEEIECPFQAARSGWLLGGEARDRAKQTFERLGATLPG